MTVDGRHPSVLIAALVLAAGALVGCGDDDDKTDTAGTGTGTAAEKKAARPYSTPAMEAKLEETLAPSSTTPSRGTPAAPTTTPTVTSVECPDDVEPGEGTAFDCRATGKQGLKGTVRVTLQSEHLTPFSYRGTLSTRTVKTTISGKVD